MKESEGGKYHCCSTAQTNTCFQFNSRYIDHFFFARRVSNTEFFPIEFFIFRSEISQNSNTERHIHTYAFVHRARCEKLCVCILNSYKRFAVVGLSHTHTHMNGRDEVNEWEQGDRIDNEPERERSGDSRHEKLAVMMRELMCRVCDLKVPVLPLHTDVVCERACLRECRACVYVSCDCVLCLLGLLVYVCAWIVWYEQIYARVCLYVKLNRIERMIVCMTTMVVNDDHDDDDGI